MSWAYIIAAAVVLTGLLAVTRLLRRMMFAFALAATVLLLLHMQQNPAEGAAALAVMGGGLGFASPLRRLILRGSYEHCHHCVVVLGAGRDRGCLPAHALADGSGTGAVDRGPCVDHLDRLDSWLVGLGPGLCCFRVDVSKPVDLPVPPRAR